MQKNRRFNAGKQFRRLPVYSFRVCRKIRELLPGKNATVPGGIMGAASPGKMAGNTTSPGKEHGIARRNIRLPHDQGGSATSPAENPVLPHMAGKGTLRADGKPGRHNGCRNLRQRTRYNPSYRNRYSAGIQGCPTARRNVRLSHDRAAECAHKPKLNTQC